MLHAHASKCKFIPTALQFSFVWYHEWFVASVTGSESMAAQRVHLFPAFIGEKARKFLKVRRIFARISSKLLERFASKNDEDPFLFLEITQNMVTSKKGLQAFFEKKVNFRRISTVSLIHHTMRTSRAGGITPRTPRPWGAQI